MVTNPARGITVTKAKPIKTRSKGFTDEEAAAVLAHALAYKRAPQEHPKTFAAKRWVPWLCGYTGARVGEIVQLRKEDVRHEGQMVVITITPEAGTVKDKDMREVPLHPHLSELGFGSFVERAPSGYLFLRTSVDGGSIRGRWRAIKNRVTEFVREVVTDPRVAPNHGWRHRFRTVGRSVDIQEAVLDAIDGHAARTTGEEYGEVPLVTKAQAVAKMPRYLAGHSSLTPDAR
jgi:integrase